ncbi:unnamed protein product, partial [marine sediment metagenome]
KIVPEEMKHGNKTLDNLKGEIIFDDVDFEYLKDKLILKNINLKIKSGEITPGQFVMFFGYINLAFGPFKFFSGIYRRYKRSVVAVKRFLKLRKIVPEEMKHGNKTLDNLKGEIIFDDVDFEYLKDKLILKNINLKIKSGETVALVGKSGVGKTTLAELIMGYYKPKEGRIFLDGSDISKLQLRWLRN